MSMIRPAPTSDWPPNSSISTRYGCPLMVIGIAFCGMLIECHWRRATSVTFGLSVRAWTSVVSRMIRPELIPATYARFPSPLIESPCES